MRRERERERVHNGGRSEKVSESHNEAGELNS